MSGETIADTLNAITPYMHDHWTDNGWGKVGYTHAHHGGHKPHDHTFDPPDPEPQPDESVEVSDEWLRAPRGVPGVQTAVPSAGTTCEVVLGDRDETFECTLPKGHRGHHEDAVRKCEWTDADHHDAQSADGPGVDTNHEAFLASPLVRRLDAQATQKAVDDPFAPSEGSTE